MKAEIRLGTMGVLAAGLLVGQIALAEGDRKGKGEHKRAGDGSERVDKGERSKERDAAREAFKEQMRERMKKHHEARKQLMEAVAAEEDASKALELVRSHCVSQHEERSAFHQQMMAERIAKVTERLGASEMDETKRQEILSKMTKHMEERKAEAQAHFGDLLESLDALKTKEDLTKRDILEALRDAAPERRRKGGRDDEGGMRRKRDNDGDGEKQRKRKKRGQDEEKPVA